MKLLGKKLSLLFYRLRAGECDRCAVLEETLKDDQDHNLRLIAKLSELAHIPHVLFSFLVLCIYIG